MDFRKHVSILPIFFDSSTFIRHINNYSYNWYFYLFAGEYARIDINTRAINVKRVSEKKVKHCRTLVRESCIRKNRRITCANASSPLLSHMSLRNQCIFQHFYCEVFLVIAFEFLSHSIPSASEFKFAFLSMHSLDLSLSQRAQCIDQKYNYYKCLYVLEFTYFIWKLYLKVM